MLREVYHVQKMGWNFFADLLCPTGSGLLETQSTISCKPGIASVCAGTLTYSCRPV